MAMICSTCGSKGSPKTVVRGSLAIEVVLWCCAILPGLIYTLWRAGGKTKVCRACGAATMVPLKSPVGREMVQKQIAMRNQKRGLG